LSVEGPAPVTSFKCRLLRLAEKQRDVICRFTAKHIQPFRRDFILLPKMV